MTTKLDIFPYYYIKNCFKRLFSAKNSCSRNLCVIISVMVKEKPSISQVMSHPENLKFAFQPVIKTDDGSIYGYEALMRPEPYTPMEVITEYARLNRLNFIEEITTYYGAKQFLENGLEGKLFLNSFPAAYISDEMMEKIHELVQNRLKEKLVLEILEYTEFSKKAHNRKTWHFKQSKTGEEIAIDDYGCGKNKDEDCIDFYKPDIVKIDYKIVHNIDSDLANQKKLLDICTYLEKKGIKILAEGVETKEEYEYLKNYPVTLMQGWYFGKPRIFSK